MLLTLLLASVCRKQSEPCEVLKEVHSATTLLFGVSIIIPLHLPNRNNSQHCSVLTGTSLSSLSFHIHVIYNTYNVIM